MPSVALIVRCFNEERHIGRLLTGALQQTRPPDEIIVVDSGSTDHTVTIASAFDVTLVTISPEQFSFGRALNRGVSAAAGHDLCVFASAHVYPVYDTWLEHLVGALHSPDVVLAYGRQETPPRRALLRGPAPAPLVPCGVRPAAEPSVLQQRQRCGSASGVGGAAL